MEKSFPEAVMRTREVLEALPQTYHYTRPDLRR